MSVKSHPQALRVLSCAVFALAMQTAQAADVPAGLAGQVIEWRRDIHAHPELGNREVRTAAKVAAHLKSLGLEVHEGIAHTGVIGYLQGGLPGPFVALRADMDALPVSEQVDLPFASKLTTEYRGETVGVMHACGHDAHVAMLMGLAQALAAQRDTLHGRVLFIFQPAEEGSPDGEEGGPG
jgi:amidohydrolase